jgi:hypothetical protein
VRFLGRVEFVELGLGAVQMDFVRRDIGEVHWDEPVNMMPMRVLWADHQMGNRKIDRVNDHADHLTGGPIGAAGAGPDDDWYLCHRPDLLVPWIGPHEPASAGLISRYEGEVNGIHAISSGRLWRCLHV